MRQELNNISVRINLNDCNIAKQLRKEFAFVDTVYSFVAYNNKHLITVNAHVSQIDDYNTITVPVMITNIVSSISTTMPEGIFCYGQPSLPILLEVLQPLLHNLATEQHRRWKRYSYEDLLQLCSCKLCELYNKGYYIHKSLLKRAFTNSVYQMLRKEPRDVTIVSSDARVKTSDDTLSVVDMIPDIQQEYDDYDKEEQVVLNQIQTEERDVLLEMLGPRQYDQLLREFRTHTISNATARQLKRIKLKLEKEGYNLQYWQRYFE